MFNFSGGCLHGVNLFIDLLQRAGVGCPEIFGPGHLGNLTQRVFVNVDLHPHEPFAAELVLNRHGSFAPGAGPDGIHLDAEGLGSLGSSAGGDLPGIVHAVGEQNLDAGFGIPVPQPVNTGGNGGTDGSTIFDHPCFQGVKP